MPCCAVCLPLIYLLMFRIQSAVTDEDSSIEPKPKRAVGRPRKSSQEPKPKRTVGRPRKSSLLSETSTQSQDVLPPPSEPKPKPTIGRPRKPSVLTRPSGQSQGVLPPPSETKPKPRRAKPTEYPVLAEEETEAAAEDSKPKRRRQKKADLQAEEENEAIVEDPKPKRKRTKAADEAQVAGTGDGALDSTSSEPTDGAKVKVKRITRKLRGARGGSMYIEESLDRKQKTGSNLNQTNDSSMATPEAEGEDDKAWQGESLSNGQLTLELDPVMMRNLSRSWHKGTGFGDRTRVNIVHGKLCDDVLDRLKPSLIKHTGCDIIDINPGVGIWSSKLHNLLKPRTHILMENDIKRYSPYLQPLLDEKDSTYRLIPKLGTVWSHLETAMSPEYLPHQKKLERDDPKLNQPNDTLLLVANLAHHPRKIFRGFPSLSMLVTYQLLSAARSHALFHKYGLVRMLLWVPDEEKMQLLPRHVHGIRKTAIEALVTCESIREIASSTEDTSRFLRDQTLALENSVEVVKRMDSQGITTPAHRQGDLEVAARNIVAGGTHEGFSDLQRFKRSYSGQIEDLQRRYDNGELSMRLDPDPENPSAIPPMNPEWEALIRLSSKIRQSNRETAAHDKLIDEYIEINHLYVELNAADPDAEATQNAKKALDDRKKAWVATLEAMSTPAWNHFIVRFDSRRVTTPFEKRDFEPLKVYSKEFYPASNAALLDLQPKALWPCLAKDFPKNYDVFEYIIGNMYASPTQSVKDAFIGLWPGAYEQLRDNCPSLTDGKTGCCFGLEHLTVRALTMEMLQEIIEAWLKWPFRPTRFDLMKRSGSSVWDPDSEEEFDGSADM
ncbi:hypothetical protein CJF31_00007296 [Rutstroemia sp. NJR-2017a BVV2]|nr:hypothetical protein CJF31_00007296 [Rutstroemia sp. NJR-2017a BVV2]